MATQRRVLLVQSHLGRKEKNGNVFPLGLCYIATSLSARRHIVSVCDLNVYDNPLRMLRSRLLEFRPEVVGLSLRNIDTTDRLDFFYYYQTLKETLHEIRSVSPFAKIMIGGTGFSMFAKLIMERHAEIDFGVYLEGDETAPELMDHLDDPEVVPGLYYRKQGKVEFSGARPFPSFDQLQSPDRSFLDVKRYNMPLAIGVQAKRGCTLSCAYCSYPSLNGRELRLRDAKEVVDEIEELQTTFGVREIIFTDSIFNIPTAHAVSICNELIRRKLIVRWSAWFALANMTYDFVKLAKQSGCYRMCLSPDGATCLTLGSLEKDHSLKDIRRVLDIAQSEPDIDFRFSLICAPPLQDIKDVIEAGKIIVRSHLLIRNSRCLVSWVRILPRTKIFSIAKEEGLIDSEDQLLPPDSTGYENLFYLPTKTRVYNRLLFSALVSFCRFARKIVYGPDGKWTLQL